MNIFDSIIYLKIRLTAAEKRAFNQWLLPKTDNSNYQLLYKLIEKHPDNKEKIRQLFNKEGQSRHFLSSCNYLYNHLVNFLIQFDSKTDEQWQYLKAIQQHKILQNRGLPVSNTSLVKLYEKNNQLNHLNIPAYLTYTIKHNHQDENKTPESETNIIKRNIKARECLRAELNYLEHYELYEVLYARFLKNGPLNNSKEIEKLNDLVFAEMQLVSSNRNPTIETRKIHLLFQSVYFFTTSKPESALNAFNELNNLFINSKNKTQVTYYFNFLKGLLYTLKRFGLDTEISEVLNGLNNTIKNNYLKKWQTEWLQIVYQHNTNLKFEQYTTLINENSPIPENEKAEIALHVAFKLTETNQWQQAAKLLKPLIFTSKILPQFHTYRLLRFFNLFIVALEHDYITIDHEVKWYKRNFTKLSSFEKLLLDFIYTINKTNSITEKQKKAFNFLHECSQLKADAFANQILLWFNHELWVKRVISNEQSPD